ncbi:MAG: hypothetical protein FJX52_12685 [Alphaproteobacteria bacterium]|nr:hypothetical protein [Alphaproteobacteria bacterium]
MRELIRTPILQGQKVKTVEQRFDTVVQEATDFTRGDVGMQGFTGTMKLAHAAEAVGIDIEPYGSADASGRHAPVCTSAGRAAGHHLHDPHLSARRSGHLHR